MVRPEDTTPAHAAACEALWDRSGGFLYPGPYTPFGFHEEGAAPRSTLQLPGAGGGVNWGGVAADPTRGLLFFHANDSSLVGWIEVVKPGKNYGNNTEGSTLPFDRGSVDGPGPYASFTAPVFNEAGERARIAAVLSAAVVPADGDRRELGRSRVGVRARYLRSTAARQTTRRQHRQRRSERHRERTGVRGRHQRSPLPRIRCADGQSALGGHSRGNVTANPMTYLGRDDKQYVAAVAGDKLVAFKLR